VTAEDIKQSDWNDVHIIAKGNNFKFFINGKPSSEFTEDIPPEKRLDKGMITLQLHDPGMKTPQGSDLVFGFQQQLCLHVLHVATEARGDVY